MQHLAKFGRIPRDRDAKVVIMIAMVFGALSAYSTSSKIARYVVRRMNVLPLTPNLPVTTDIGCQCNTQMGGSIISIQSTASL